MALIAAVVGFAFYKYYVLSDYYIIAQTACDLKTERCFIYECDPEYDEECLNASQEDRVSYYKLIKKKAYNMPPCETIDGCRGLVCDQGEDCEEIFCDESNEAGGEACSNPGDFR